MNREKKGSFIVIEGGDGAGKDTQIGLLKKDFPQFVYTREPGGTSLGKTLRGMVLHETHGSLPLLTEAFLFLADRAQHAAEVIEPALKAGKVVVSNRSWVSMMSYQVYGRQQFELKPIIEASIKEIFRNTPMSLVVILDLEPAVGLERQRQQKTNFDVMENMDLAARTRIRDGFLEIAKTLPQAKVIDASRSVEEVYAGVKAAVERATSQ